MLIFRLIFLSSLCLSLPVLGLSDDTENYRFWLKDKTEFTREPTLLNTDEPFINNDFEINFDGKKYTINNNVNEMGTAIYIALNRQQYADVIRLLPHYEKLQQHDPLLVKFSQAEIAKAEQNYSAAIKYYQDILAINPDFLRIELELARVYFIDKQNKESLDKFNQALNKYQKKLPTNVLNTISQFTSALDKRTRWSGSFSLGYGYNTNLNQVPGDGRQSCHRNSQSLFCYGAKNKVQDYKFVYDGNIARTFPIIRHQSLQFKAYTYGYKYDTEATYNENTTNLRLFYQYSDVKKSFSFGPIIELKFVGDKNRYHGIGAGIDSEYLFTPQFSLNMNIDYQNINYRSPYESNDGNKTNIYLTGIYAISPDMILFGGFDTSLVNKKYSSDSYKQYGIRGGIFKDYNNDYNFLGMLSYKKTKFNDIEYSLSENIRNDDEQLYLAKLSSPKYSVMTFTPSLSYKYRINKSSTDALYSYKQNEVEFKLEKRF